GTETPDLRDAAATQPDPDGVAREIVRYMQERGAEGVAFEPHVAGDYNGPTGGYRRRLFILAPDPDGARPLMRDLSGQGAPSSSSAERIGLWWPGGSRPGRARGVVPASRQVQVPAERPGGRCFPLLPSGQLAAVPESQGASKSADRCAPFPCV